jgi:two-component system, OmpR family, response regulator ResD
MPGEAVLTEEKRMQTRALVVQSDADRADRVAVALADAGIQAIVVPDGHEIMLEVETWAPDVVLIDLTLPPLDGWQVLAALGARLEPPLLVVRLGAASEVVRAIALGADAWVDDDVHVVAAAGRLTLTNAA